MRRKNIPRLIRHPSCWVYSNLCTYMLDVKLQQRNPPSLVKSVFFLPSSVEWWIRRWRKSLVKMRSSWKNCWIKIGEGSNVTKWKWTAFYTQEWQDVARLTRRGSASLFLPFVSFIVMAYSPMFSQIYTYPPLLDLYFLKFGYIEFNRIDVKLITVSGWLSSSRWCSFWPIQMKNGIFWRGIYSVSLLVGLNLNVQAQ